MYVCVCVSVREKSVSDRDESKPIKSSINHGVDDSGCRRAGLVGFSDQCVHLAISGSIELKYWRGGSSIVFHCLVVISDAKTIHAERTMQSLSVIILTIQASSSKSHETRYSRNPALSLQSDGSF